MSACIPPPSSTSSRWREQRWLRAAGTLRVTTSSDRWTYTAHRSKIQQLLVKWCSAWSLFYPVHSPLLLKFCHSFGKNCWSQFVANRQPINKKAFGMKVAFWASGRESSAGGAECCSRAMTGTNYALRRARSPTTARPGLENDCWRADQRERWSEGAGAKSAIIDAIEKRQRASELWRAAVGLASRTANSSACVTPRAGGGGTALSAPRRSRATQVTVRS